MIKFRCIYKHGDELLQDALCVAVMKEMNHVFEEESVDAEVVLYEVILFLFIDNFYGYFL
jgi:hypothetical protein